VDTDSLQFPREPEATETKVSWPQRLWSALTKPSPSIEDIGDQRLARLAASMLFAISLFNIIGIVLSSNPAYFSLVVSLSAYGISRTRWFRISVFFFALSFSLTAYTTILEQGNQADFGALIFIYVPLSLIIASSFLSTWAVLLLGVLNIGAYLSLTRFGITLPENITPQIAIIVVISLVLILLVNFRNNLENLRLARIMEANLELEALRDELEERVTRRTEDLTEAIEYSAHQSGQLIAIAELARTFTQAQNLAKLLPTITDFISERLGCYHVGIFLNDEEEIFTVLRAANSPGGQNMLKRGHRLRIGRQGIVGYVVRTGKARIALDVGSDAVYFDNPDLPETRSEMALPLRLGPEYIGALDIQSTEENAFSTADMPVFTTLADQVAIAIQNSRLLTQAQSALHEVEEAYAQQTGQSWEKYSKLQPTTGYHFDGSGSNPLTDDGDSKIEFDAGKVIPMRLRGQVIGNLKLKATSKDREWSDEEIALAESAIERTALALENARLVEEAQRRASKERIITEGSTRISAAIDIESILQATAEELEQALGSSEVVIQLESEE